MKVASWGGTSGAVRVTQPWWLNMAVRAICSTPRAEVHSRRTERPTAAVASVTRPSRCHDEAPHRFIAVPPRTGASSARSRRAGHLGNARRKVDMHAPAFPRAVSGSSSVRAETPDDVVVTLPSRLAPRTAQAVTLQTGAKPSWSARARHAARDSAEDEGRRRGSGERSARLQGDRYDHIKHSECIVSVAISKAST